MYECITTCGCANVLRCSRVSAQDVVQCVINRLLSCPCDVVFVSGALRWVAAKKVTTPPSPKGQHPASRHTRHSLPTSWAPMQKRSRTVRPILFAFLGSRRQWLCQAMHARLLPFLSPRSGDSTPVQVVRGTSHAPALLHNREAKGTSHVANLATRSPNW